jgi:diacylglycerol kinase (ATP)
MKSQNASFITKFLLKFKYSFEGLVDGLMHDFSIQLQFILGSVAILFAFILKFTDIEWCIWIICIAQVISMEYINSSIESIIDRFDPSWHLLTKQAKDLGSAAVFFSAMLAGIVGIILIARHLG